MATRRRADIANRIRETVMRALMMVAVVALTAAGTEAHAQSKQPAWCARYDWSTYNCGFYTYAQCLANISGVGGYCEPNTFASPRAEPRRQQRRERRNEPG
jgi:hypothetical protein